jgi:drug/metabolite transporter (DMT)-like permease
VLGALALGLLFLLSNLTLQYGAARLSANITAVVMVTEVLFASVSAVWLGAGQLSLPLLVGGTLIVAAALLALWKR